MKISPPLVLGIVLIAMIVLLYLAVLLLEYSEKTDEIRALKSQLNSSQEKIIAHAETEELRGGGSAGTSGEAAKTASVTAEPSLYGDCNNNPDKYDLYDGNITGKSSCEGDCRFEWVRISGTSMNPTLYTNDYVYVRHDSDYNLKEGDVIQYVPLGTVISEFPTVTHRIVGMEKDKMVYADGGTFYEKDISENMTITRNGKEWKVRGPYYLVKGDSNDFCEVVPYSQIRGVVVSKR